MLSFLPCFICLDFTDSPNGHRVGRRIYSLLCQLDYSYALHCILMFILWVLGVKIRYVICLFVVISAVTGRTHVNWRYRTLKARRDSTMRYKARLTATQSHSDQSVCVTDTDLPFINKLIPSVEVQMINRVCCPRRPPRRLAYRTFFICNLR